MKQGDFMRDNSSDVFHKDRFILNSFSGQVPHFRKYKVTFVKTELKNFYLDTQYVYFTTYGSQFDSIEIRNFHVSEGTFSQELCIFLTNTEVILANSTLENVTEVDSFAKFFYNQEVSIDSLSMINYSTRTVRSWNDIEVFSSPYSQVVMSGFLFQNCTLRGNSFVSMKSSPASFQFLNSRYEDIQMDGDISIVALNSISSFSIINHSFDGISIPKQGDSVNALFRVFELRLVNSLVIIKDITISNSELSLFLIDSVSADLTDREIVVENLSIKNSYIKSPRAIVATGGFKFIGQLRLIFNNVNVDGVRFKNIGSIFQFSHKLNNPVVVQNSIFKNLSSANIVIEGSDSSSSDLGTAVIFQN